MCYNDLKCLTFCSCPAFKTSLDYTKPLIYPFMQKTRVGVKELNPISDHLYKIWFAFENKIFYGQQTTFTHREEGLEFNDRNTCQFCYLINWNISASLYSLYAIQFNIPLIKLRNKLTYCWHSSIVIFKAVLNGGVVFEGVILKGLSNVRNMICNLC